MAETYTVLARRYRSQTFDELVGQEAIAQTLKNAVASGRIAHAFLFTGTRGVGKTSSARILAKALNCPTAKDNGGQPCGTCDTCKAIARGEDMDVIEIDGASNNGVEQVRELRANAGIRPARSEHKVYIIDEVHMLSSGAFNALLKTLEEPPSHVKFIFATTDVHKVPATIISRCQRFDFKNIPTAKIADHLRKICTDEGIAIDEDAVHRIARLGNGSMRDALSLLDRVLSLGEKHITEKLLEDLLGKPPTAAIADLVTALANGDAGSAITQADGLLKEGMGPEQVLGEVVEFLRNLMLVSVCGKDTDLLDVPTDMRGAYTDLADRFDAAMLVHMIALTEGTLRSLKSSTMGRPLFDALIVRLAMTEQFSTIKELVQGGGGGGGGGGNGLAGNAQPVAGQKKNDGGGAVADLPRAAAPAPARAAPISTSVPTVAPATPVVVNAAPASAPTTGRPGAGRPTAAAPAPAGDDEAESSVFKQMQAMLARKAAEGAANGNGGGRPHAGAGEGAATADATASAESVIPDVLPTELPAIWQIVRRHLIATKNGSINTILGPVSQLLSCDGETGEAVLAIPAHQFNFANGRPRVKMEESLSAVMRRQMTLELVATDDTAMREEAARAAEASRVGGVAGQRIPPELKDAVLNAPIVKTLLERLGGDVSAIEMVEGGSEGQ